MKMSKFFNLLVVLLLLILSMGTGYAEENNNSEGFNLLTDILTIFPQEKIDKAKLSGYDVKYSKYNPSRYHLELNLDQRQFWEVQNQVSDASHYIMNYVNNFFWEVLLNWNFTVIMIVENAFSLDVVDQFSDAVQEAVQELAGFGNNGYQEKGLIGNFIIFMIILAGAYLAYKGMIQRKATQALSGMLVSIVIFVLGLAFFANAGAVMRYLNDISSGLSQEAMDVGITFENRLNPDEERKRYPSEVASMIIADKLYNMFVYEPYLMLQYGKTSSNPELTKERLLRILDHRVGSTKRIDAVRDEKTGASGYNPNPMVSTSGTFERLTLLMLLGVSHLLLGVLFLLIAGAMIIYQFMFVLSALFAPFAFLFALNPAWSNVASNWFRSFIGYQLIKLMIGLFFSMLLILSQFLYQMNPPEKFGYVWTITMQLILVAGVVWKRNDLFSMLQALGKEKKSEININMPLNYMSKYTNNLTNRIQKLNTRSWRRRP